jgi:hypothetical protein
MFLVEIHGRSLVDIRGLRNDRIENPHGIAIEAHGDVIISQSQYALPDDLVDIHINPRPNLAAHEANALPEEDLQAAMGHVVQVQPRLHFLFFIQNGCNHIGCDHIGNNIRMSNLDTF